MQHSNYDQVLEFFGGAVRTRILEQPDNAYTFEAVFRPGHPLGSKLFAQKPPMHFHPYQNEHIRVLEGKLVVEVDGHEHVRSAHDDDFRVDAWTNHRLYPFCPAISGYTEVEDVRVLIWGQKTSEPFHEDILFLENWFKYQDDIVMNKNYISLLQILSMFDAGGSYLAPPGWLPLGQSISRCIGIAVGRWFGGLMGYQPFYQKWSTDWELACQKMETSFFQRRFADRSKIE
ncbi:hypothetical protein BJ166DRAFT_73933 [Pestalotiopsis sp. NC0098]|nr:hypothetical protein BJ166DRAFT_73933 [Pestalotiopsis sp. NC0098]